jgi:CBS domain containing-hemolysin-like protein
VSRAALFCFKPLVIFNRGVKPVDPPDEPRQTPVTAEELKTWAAAANETGGLEPEERRMIQSIFEFGDILCREVMVPRLDVRSLDVNTTVSDAIDAFIRTGHSRIPVFEDDLDNIVGILYAKDLLQHTDEWHGKNLWPDLYARHSLSLKQKKWMNCCARCRNAEFTLPW